MRIDTGYSSQGAEKRTLQWNMENGRRQNAKVRFSFPFTIYRFPFRPTSFSGR
jgi:hypothetical protein